MCIPKYVNNNKIQAAGEVISIVKQRQLSVRMPPTLRDPDPAISVVHVKVHQSVLIPGNNWIHCKTHVSSHAGINT